MKTNIKLLLIMKFTIIYIKGGNNQAHNCNYQGVKTIEKRYVFDKFLEGFGRNTQDFHGLGRLHDFHDLHDRKFLVDLWLSSSVQFLIISSNRNEYRDRCNLRKSCHYCPYERRNSLEIPLLVVPIFFDQHLSEGWLSTCGGLEYHSIAYPRSSPGR